MRLRQKAWGPLIALGPACLGFTLTVSAQAQAQDPAEPAPPAEAPAEAESTEAAAPEAPAEEAPAVDTPQDEEPPRAPDNAPEPKEEAVREDVGEVIGVTILPGSAFPEPKIRGLKGGSLWLTMHGLQWPYQPKIAGTSGIQLGLSGSAWVDTAYTSISSDNNNDPDRHRWTNQGRAVLRATPSYSTDDGWFVQGQMEYVAQGDQTVAGGQMGAVDDLYVRAGKWGLFDVTVGRFQGWEVYHYGMGLDLNTFERRGAEPSQGANLPPGVYGADFFWDRPNGGSGNIAAHIYITDYLRVEALGRLGTAGGSNLFGVRPVGVLDLGYVKVKAGWEWGKQTPQPQSESRKDKVEQNGFGASAQFVLDPYVEGGLNFGRGFVDDTNDKGLYNARGSNTTTSIGGFLNGRPFGSLLVGLGANLTTREPMETNPTVGNPNYGKANQYSQMLAFAAVQYAFWDRLFLKFVASHAKYEIEDNVSPTPVGSFTYKSYGGRLRMMYLF